MNAAIRRGSREVRAARPDSAVLEAELKMIECRSAVFGLLAVVILASAGMHANDSRGQGVAKPADDAPAANRPAAPDVGEPGAAGGPALDERLLGGPHPYDETYDERAITNRAQQAALIKNQNLRPATPTDQAVENQGGQARPQSFVQPGTATLPQVPLTKGTTEKQVRTPDAAALSTYRSGSADPAAPPRHPIYKSPW
jgi:hypothetical protein